MRKWKVKARSRGKCIAIGQESKLEVNGNNFRSIFDSPSRISFTFAVVTKTIAHTSSATNNLPSWFRKIIILKETQALFVIGSDMKKITYYK